jgi:hypothetical protein
MAASNEWTVHHLSPLGWTSGDQQRDFAQLRRVEAPLDRVLSVIYKEVCNGYGPVQESQQEQWRSDDAATVTALLDRFGPPPKSL